MSKLDRGFVGHRLGALTYKVVAERTKAYAVATNDERPQYMDESAPGGIIAPPLFVVVPQSALASAIVSDLSLTLDRILHGEQDMTFSEPIRPGDVLVTDAQVVDIRDTSTGQTVTSEIATRTQDGAPRAQSLVTIFVRDPTISRGSRPASTEPSRGEPLARRKEVVRSDQPAIYAEASGDHNAPHTDDGFAKSIGFRSVILQGLCTMAFTSKAIVDSVCDGDPTRLQRLKVRFSNVVYPNDVLTTSIWGDDGVHEFETANQERTLVIKSGRAEIRS